MSDFNCTSRPVSRKPRMCQECGRTILPGERYSRTAGAWQGDFFTDVACMHCAIARMIADYADDYYSECYYGGLSEWASSDEDPKTLRLRACLRAQWRYQSGALMPLPESPWTQATRLNARIEEAS